MTCQLEIVSEQREIVGDDAVREFGETGGTIGRSLHNDWILPDPERFVSGRHAAIDFKGGIYYLVDTSTNGIYVNCEFEPIGKGNPRRLFDGDTLRIGNYEITVSIQSGESLVMPLDEPASKVTDHVASLVPEESLYTGMQLLDEEAITGDEEFQSAMFGHSNATDDVERATQKAAEKVKKRQPTKSTSVAEADLAATDLLDSFLDGLGINRAELHPTADLAEVMQNAGEVMREFVTGISQLLASRANLKKAFRLDQTTVLPRHNNPLKFSADVKESIKQLLVGKEGEYLGPRDAIREVCRDLLFHQDAFLDAMGKASSEFADQFEPEELIEGFDHSMDDNIFSKLNIKSKYWQMYCDLYPVITKKGGSGYPQMYAEEFVKAYESQVAEYKRFGGTEEHLMATVKQHKKNRVTDSAEEKRRGLAKG